MESVEGEEDGVRVRFGEDSVLKVADAREEGIQVTFLDTVCWSATAKSRVGELTMEAIQRNLLECRPEGQRHIEASGTAFRL